MRLPAKLGAGRLLQACSPFPSATSAAHGEDADAVRRLGATPSESCSIANHADDAEIFEYCGPTL
eukprot:11613575-Alexandrium_andersonii.AAC.1